MPGEKMEASQQNNLMSTDEIFSIAKIFVGLGINKIRLTGGEPLVRREVREILEKLSSLPVELTISTNGFLANDFVETFHKSGIRQVNVSLDSLDENQFYFLTKRNHFQKILNNIYLLLKEGFEVKVNAVIMKNVNENAILDLVGWTRDFPFQVRFIEFMPFDKNDWQWNKIISMRDMLDRIENIFEVEELEDDFNSTSRNYRVFDFRGTFGFISTMTEPFCDSCNRLRLTADGKMKNCLFSISETDLLSAFRKGENILPLIFENVQNKKQERGGQFDFEKIENRPMITIGG
jgi:molybdenum cofactor biosynthesis enzyme MoaA